MSMSKKQTQNPAAAKAARAKKPTKPKATRKAGKQRAATKTVKPGPTVLTASAQRLAPRLPAPGTAIQKKDRYGIVRCECSVEEGGIRYDGNLYRSLSAAAMAAAKDLELTNKTQNGWTFWGLTKPPRLSTDPLGALERGWARYQVRLAAMAKDGVTDENRAKVLTALGTHAQAIEDVRGQVA